MTGPAIEDSCVCVYGSVADTDQNQKSFLNPLYTNTCSSRLRGALSPWPGPRPRAPAVAVRLSPL